MTKRITLNQTSYFHAPVLWVATSRRYGVTAYGRTVAEAKQRLFLTRQAEYRNCYAAVKLLPPEEHRHYFGCLT